MLGFALIGTPKGFESVSYRIRDEAALGARVDLDNSVISVPPGSQVLMAFRESKTVGTTDYYFVLYRFATEINATRPGTYYGSVVSLRNASAAGDLILTALTDLAAIVEENCLMPDKRFFRGIRDLKFTTPRSVHVLSDHLQAFDSTNLEFEAESGFVLVGEEIKSEGKFIEEFFFDHDMAYFQRLFASQSTNVIDAVKEKRQLLTINEDTLTVVRNRRKRLDDGKAVALGELGGVAFPSSVRPQVVPYHGAGRISQLEHDVSILRRIGYGVVLLLVINFLCIGLMFWFGSDRTYDRGDVAQPTTTKAQQTVTEKPVTTSATDSELDTFEYVATETNVATIQDLTNRIYEKCDCKSQKVKDKFFEDLLTSMRGSNAFLRDADASFNISGRTIVFRVARCCNIANSQGKANYRRVAAIESLVSEPNQLARNRWSTVPAKLSS